MYIGTLEEYNSAVEQSKILDEAYYNDKPLVSDKKYDELYFAIQNYEKATGHYSPESPTQKIQYDTLSSLNKVTHSHWMGSADKTKSLDDIKKFIKGHEILLMWKLDGLSVSLTYDNGVLVRAETRGQDGWIGEDITHNARVIKNIPRRVPCLDRFTVDGEVVSTIQNFEQFKGEYKNPRNFASGSVRLLDSEESAKRNLEFYAWETDYAKGGDALHFRLWELYQFGFQTVFSDIIFASQTEDDEILEDMIETFRGAADHEGIPIDGLIFKYNYIKEFEAQGKTSHHYKGMLALKFYNEEYETYLKNMVWQMSRNGRLTPVAEFYPVEIDGTTVTRASLHNVSVLEDKLGIPYLRQRLWITKRNEIIPQVERADKCDIPHDHSIEIPHWCPVCGKATEIVVSDSGVRELNCTNPDCEGKINKKIEHFCSKKGLNIKGISEKTIEFLAEKDWLNEISDLYKLKDHYSEWIVEKGWGKASVDKILTSIEESKNVPLNKFLSALGIPLIGENEAKEIAKHVKSYTNLRAMLDIDFDFTQWEGFGDAKANSITWFNWDHADLLNNYVHASDYVEEKTDGSLQGQIFVITGKLKSYKNRDELKHEIENRGGKVASSVTAKTNYLIANAVEDTTKYKTAVEKNIPIITEEEYKCL